MKRRLLTGGVLVCLVLFSHIALAQGRPSGIRVTVTAVDGLANTVDFDVTLNTSSVYGVPTLTAPTGLLGDYVFTEFYATTYPPGFTGQVLSPVIAAIDYGDGQTLQNGRIPQVSPGVYRGSFSHTYPAQGTYDLRVATAAMLGLNDVPVTVTTGNTINNPNQAPTTPTGAQSFLGSWVGRSFFGGTLTYNLVQPVGGDAFEWGISNSVTSGAPYGAPGGGVLVAAGLLEVPTASFYGLLALGIAISLGGLVLLWRR